MNAIERMATKFTQIHFDVGTPDYEEIVNAAKEQLDDIDSHFDKITFINIILNKSNIDYEQHKLECTNPEHCIKNEAYDIIAYKLEQELNRLGVHFNEDTFSNEEKKQAESKLDQILKELHDLKIGQQVIYEDFTKEINELKNLYFLGKKKWYQLFIGKSVDMVASGIVSETVSKHIIEVVKSTLPTLLG